MARLDNSAALCKEAVNQELDRAIRVFQMQLFKKTPDELRRKGSCLRLKEVAIKIASLLVESTGQQELPIDLKPICKKMLIHTIVPDKSLSSYTAELTPDANGFTIRISDREAIIRRRVAIAHEIGHTLFYDTRKLPPIRIFAGTPRSPRTDKEEWLSWDFARELLLPRMLVEDKLKQESTPSAQKIIRFARNWWVSVELLCHRVIRDLRIWKNCAIFTFDLVENRIDRATIRTYRGQEFPQLRFSGQVGLLTSSSEFAKLMSRFQKLKLLECPLEYLDYEMWVQLFRYPEVPSRVVGVLEIPALTAHAVDPERQGTKLQTGGFIG